MADWAATAKRRIQQTDAPAGSLDEARFREAVGRFKIPLAAVVGGVDGMGPGSPELDRHGDTRMGAARPRQTTPIEKEDRIPVLVVQHEQARLPPTPDHHRCPNADTC